MSSNADSAATVADSDATVARDRSPIEVPGYQIESLIATGGMGAVYCALDHELERHVAIKFVHGEFSKDPDYVARFKQEALIVARFQHPNIVTIHASGAREGTYYIVMEYVSGGTLEQRIETRALSTRSIYEVAREMASALAYAHARGVVHRDFKPRNVLMSENGRALLSDFGVAKSQVKASAVETRSGAVIGNPRYMAPEQALGLSATDRADVYSWALVLYEMLKGSLPRSYPVRDARDERQIAHAVGREPAQLIARCLGVKPEDRPSAAECLEWLEQRSTRILAPRRRPPWLLVAAGTLGLAALGTGVVLWQRGMMAQPLSRLADMASSVPAPATQRIPLRISTDPADASIYVDGDALAGDSAELLPGAHTLAVVAPGHYGEVRHIVLERGRPSATETFALVPTRLPTAAEQETFLRLADAASITEKDAARVEEQTLHTALQAKLLGQGRRLDDLNRLARDVASLRRAGDPRAAVAAMLIDTIQSGHIRGALSNQSLLAASQGGDAMASLFLAAAYRSSISSTASPITPSDPRFKSYCDYMALAAEQGWSEVANRWSQQDHCPR